MNKLRIVSKYFVEESNEYIIVEKNEANVFSIEKNINGLWMVMDDIYNIDEAEKFALNNNINF